MSTVLKYSYLVGINGPIGCGKSWIGHRLEDLFPKQTTQVEVTAPFWEIAKKMYPRLTIGQTYDSFKRTDFKSVRGRYVTGRQLVIELIESARQFEPAIVTRLAIPKHPKTKLVFLHSVGDYEEAEAFVTTPFDGHRILIGLGGQFYFAGERFPGDSRKCLSDFPGISNVDDSTQALHVLSRAIQSIELR